MTNIVGILNVTPDSFSDGNEFYSLESQISQLYKLINDGADVIDIGAESTRPGAKSISSEEEWTRLKEFLPIAIKICKENNKLISIDSKNYLTIKNSLELGVDHINDVSGGINQDILNIIAEYQVKYIITHNLGVPPQKHIIMSEHTDIITEIVSWFNAKINLFSNFGIKKENIIVDVGIGFGKNTQQSIKILQNISQFKQIGCPTYVGHSRKSFLKEIFLDLYHDNNHNKINHSINNTSSNLTKEFLSEFDSMTALISKYLIEQNIDYIRIHNILLTKLIQKITSYF